MSTAPETKPNPTLTLEALRQAVAGNAPAFRCRRVLQPAGGEGDKVYPPTYAGAVYAVEKRRVPGRDQAVVCVLLDSVQSQANRMESALQDAIDAGQLQMPLVTVDFSKHDPTGDLDDDEKSGRLLDRVGTITSLQVPHRLADAILRDSEFVGSDGSRVPFRKSEKGKSLNLVSPTNATALLELCPTALIFGMWDSTGPKGGLGPKFERAMVSEITGIGAQFGIKTASRIDPLVSGTGGITLYRAPQGQWTLDEATAIREKGKPAKIGKQGKVSEANLGNVTPSFAEYGKRAEGLDPLKFGTAQDGDLVRQGGIAAGGVTIEYAEQVTTLSLICLRRLRFPIEDQANPQADVAARTTLAALALCAATLASEAGLDLRSRCLLWPQGRMEWELLDRPGEPPQAFSLTGAQALSLVKEAADAASNLKLPWPSAPLKLEPSPQLAELVRRSQQLAVSESDEPEA